MYDTPKDLIDALQATPSIIDRLLESIPSSEAHASGKDGGWSPVEVICHLRDAEERALERMRLMRDQVEPFLAGYDQEGWARERNYSGTSMEDALADFKHYRAQHVAELTALSSEDWERTGRHEELGRITIAGHTLHMVSHDLIHAAQLARG